MLFSFRRSTGEVKLRGLPRFYYSAESSRGATIQPLQEQHAPDEQDTSLQPGGNKAA
jgi:hypothetical protein